MNRFLLSIVLVALTGCGGSPVVRYEQFETEAEPLYQAYFFGDPSIGFAAMSELSKRMEAADPSIWKVMDWGTYASWTYGRAAVAAELAGMSVESQRFRVLAVESARRRKEWSDAEQKMLPVTPIPSYEETERGLFESIRVMDEVIRKDGGKKTEGEPGATDNPEGAK
jgi:hypothetical protein